MKLSDGSRRIEIEGAGYWVKFISRYRDGSTYGVKAPGREARITLYDGGEVTGGDTASREAVTAYLAAEEVEYQEWRQRNAGLLVTG